MYEETYMRWYYSPSFHPTDILVGEAEIQIRKVHHASNSDSRDLRNTCGGVVS